MGVSMYRKDEAEYLAAQTPNHAVAIAFARKFSPPLVVVRTQNINGVAAKDGYMCAYYDDSRRIGATLVVFGDGQFQAYFEATGRNDATKAAEAILASLEQFDRIN